MSNRHQELASPEANDFCKELASPKQTALGKDISNPLIVDSLLRTCYSRANSYCFVTALLKRYAAVKVS
ncbi:hypothetical protein Tco_1446009 [Tanacetum coccineum]